MKINSARIVAGKVLLEGRGQEFYLPDGVYRRADGHSVNVRGHRIEQLSAVKDDAQLANIDLQNALQKQQQTLQTMSNISKMLHDTAMAIIRKFGP